MIQSLTGSAASVELLVSQAADEFAAALARGERPTVAEFAARYPEIANLLRQVLPTIEAIGSLSAEGVEVDATTAPKNLGDFLIEREIGRGGMGVVYAARQISLGRTVALKVLPFAGVLDEKQLQRFKNEARAAATLEHPHIVPVYSVGCERGIHYFAMRFIDGQSLAEILQAIPAYRASETDAPPSPSGLASPLPHDPANRAGNLAEDHREQAAVLESSENTGTVPSLPAIFGHGAVAPASSPPETRPEIQGLISTDAKFDGPVYLKNVARLGIQAAEALAYAHEQGILHRDIKPGNLLLDESGHLWVADFGLARLEQDASLTITGDMLGTLRYMSPEQALGQRVLDDRSDVYSLGVTLYELLVLRPAFSGRDRQEILRRIASEDPTAPRHINPRIPRDLETIVLKAISKDPAGRYQTARQLAEDLRHYSEDQPIQARRPRFVEQCVKWSRRHPAVLLSAAIIAAVIAIASSVAAILINGARNDAIAAGQAERQSRERADQQTELALKTLNSVVFEIQSKLDGVPGAAGARQSLLSTAIDGLKHVDRTLNTSTKTDRALLRSHLDLANSIAFAGSLKGPGRTEQALKEYQVAQEIAVDLAQSDSRNTEAQRNLADSCGNLASLYLQFGKVSAARDEYQRKLEVAQRLTQDDPHDSMARSRLAESYVGRGEAYQRLGNPLAARDDCTKAIVIYENLVQDNPSITNIQVGLYSAYGGLANANRYLGDGAAVRAALRRSFEICQKLAQADTDKPLSQIMLAQGYNDLGCLKLMLGDTPAARDALQRGFDCNRNWARADPHDVRAQYDLAYAYWWLGNVNQRLGDVSAARADYDNSLKINQSLAKDDPKNTSIRRRLKKAQEALGDVYLRLGNTSGSRDACQKAFEISEKLVSDDPADVLAIQDLADCYHKLGYVNLRIGDAPAASNEYQKSFEICLQMTQRSPKNPGTQQHLAVAFRQQAELMLQTGDILIARDYLQRSSEICRKLTQSDSVDFDLRRNLAESNERLGNANLLLGDVSAARNAHEKALEIFQNLAQADPCNSAVLSNLAQSYEGLAAVNNSSNDLAAARKNFRKGLEIRERLAQQDPQDAEALTALAHCYGNLGRLEESAEEFPAAMQWFKQGIAILENQRTDRTIADQPRCQGWLQEQQQAATVCRAAQQAIDSLDFALGQPKEIVPELLGVRSRALARRGQSQVAAITADKLDSLEATDTRDLFQSAIGFALCADGARAAQRQAKAPTDKRALEERYEARAVELLEQAHAKGYFKDPVQRAALAANHDLDPLRRRDDFQKLFATK